MHMRQEKKKFCGKEALYSLGGVCRYRAGVGLGG